MSEDQLVAAMEHALYDNGSEDGVEFGLLDEIIYWDELKDRIKPVDEDDEDEDDEEWLVSSATYAKVCPGSLDLEGDKTIAVVHAAGMIGGKKSGIDPLFGETMGYESVNRDLKKAWKDEDGYYWFNLPKSAGFPFLALVEHTNYLPPQHYGGDHILYCGDYLEPDHEYFQLSQEQLLARFAPALRRINPQFTLDWVKNTWLFRTKYAQPVPLLNHSKNIPAIQTPLPGLYFASMSQVYPWDRGTNFAVEIGRRAVRLMNDE